MVSDKAYHVILTILIAITEKWRCSPEKVGSCSVLITNMSKTLHFVVSEVYNFTVDPLDIMKKSFQIVHLEGE